MHIELTFIGKLDDHETKIIKASSIKEVWKPAPNNTGCTVVSTDGTVSPVSQSYGLVSKKLGIKI